MYYHFKITGRNLFKHSLSLLVRLRKKKMKQSLIKLKEVSKIYGKKMAEVRALQDVSAEINKGEFVAIMGPSGSGKSTFMNIVGCLDIPSKGRIFLENRNISLLEESELAQIRGKKIGFVFQQFNLIPTFNALENVMLPMIFQNIPKKVREKRALDLLNQVGLKKRIKHLPSELSGGEQQRIAIARALANDPEIILADEPTGNLDSKTGKEIIMILKELNKKGKTIIVVTHDNDIAKCARKIIKLKDGRIIKK